MFHARTASPSAPPDACAPQGVNLLQVCPTTRPYPLLDFLRVSPLLRSDIGRGSPGIPLTLRFELRDAQARPIPRAAVYIWHHDPRGWTIDFQGHELDAVSRMRGVQVSDEDGLVGFQTVYPARYRDGSVPVYLQIYLNDGQQVTGRTDVCVLLPHQAGGPLRGIPLALPVPGRAERPRFNAAGDAAVLRLERLGFDTTQGGLLGHVRIDLAL